MINELKSHKSFAGKTQFWEHDSSATKTKMKFSTFMPHQGVRSCLIWLSGLTCTDENFITKSFVQSHLAETQTMVICPDTSPRGLQLKGEHDSYDFGSGAGFYVNATEAPYDQNYQMYDYVVKELYHIIQEKFGVSDRVSIFGHSMGGHGALVIGLREPNKFKSVSAFSPITNPTQCPWGQKALAGYLGDNAAAWRQYDACELLKAGNTHPHQILVSQGLADEFMVEQLLPKNLEKACQNAGQDLVLKRHEGYDHSYYFISSFLKEHIVFHLDALREE